jgi:quinol monooxygenase YgiN
MVMTILEAHVARDQWETLKQAYQQAGANLPPQQVQNFLTQSVEDPTRWQLCAIWKSREALDEYRQSVQTPGGVLIFRAAGAEPKLALFDVQGFKAR